MSTNKIHIPPVVMRTLTEGSWQSKLILTKDKTPRALLANALIALRHAPQWLGVLGYNSFASAVAIVKPTPWGAALGALWTDHEDRLTAEWLQLKGIHVGIEIAGQAVQTVAQEHSFHPVRNWLNTLKWDSTKRFDTWLSTYLGVEDSDYARAVGARWLISAVARIYQPGTKADCCLILEGKQGAKKSSALRALAQPYFTDELADLGSKDSALQTQGVWIIELSELDSLSRSEVSKIKAFMSRQTDRFRPPYGKRLVESPRQCIFAGSVNGSTYLRDETGGRRFWPVACGEIDDKKLAGDRDQLWAEAVVAFRDGQPWWLDKPMLVDAAAEEQADRYEGDPWQAEIQAWLAERADVSLHDILRCCLGLTPDKMRQPDQNRAARCLRALGWERYRDRDGKKRAYRYRPISV